jgi:hypothetical protein
VLWGRFDEKVLATLAAVAFAFLAMIVVRADVRWQQVIALVLCLLGLALILACVVAQFGGFSIRNRQLITEQWLGDNLSVFKGILLAAAPASIFALRLGLTRSSRRAIAWSGFCGLWLPMVCSISLASVAKMCGARLYWRPSVPIGVPFAFAWLAPSVLKDLRLVWILLSFVPLVCSALWVEHLTDELGRTWKRWLALLSLGLFGIGAILVGEFSFESYYLPWCWSILCGSLLFGAYMLGARTCRRFSRD